MTSSNDITGDPLRSKPASDKFRSGYDLIDWGKNDTNTDQGGVEVGVEDSNLETSSNGEGS